MKELRPRSTGRSEIRVPFAFDTKRRAILLVGGYKSSDWKTWYDGNIPIADDRLDEHELQIQTRPATKTNSKSARSSGNKKIGRR